MVKKALISLLSIALIGCSTPILNNTTQNNDYSQYADLDQEYSQFTTKALTESYLKKKMDKWTSSPTYSKKLLREVEYAKYKHPDVLKDVVEEVPPIFTDIVSDSSVVQKRQEPSFDNYIKYIDPHPHDVTAIDATNVTDETFTANWTNVDNAKGYKLFVDNDTTPITVGKVTSFNVTGLTPSSTHTYHLKATNLAGETPKSNDVNVKLYDGVLQIAQPPVDVTSTGFTAKWDTVEGATAYKLFVDDVLVYTGLDTSFVVTNLTAGIHKYKIVVVLNGKENVSNEKTVTIGNDSSGFLASVATVAISASDITKTSFTANWNAFTGATNYKLYLDNVLVYTGSNIYFTVNNLQRASNHKYKVIANNGTIDNLVSNEISVTTLDTSVLQAPVATSATAINDVNFTANWGSVVGASEYKLYLDGNLVYSGSDTSFTVTGLTANTQYSYYVKCVVDSNLSESSNAISVKTKFGEFKIADLAGYSYKNVLVNKNNGDFTVISYDNNNSTYYAQNFNSDGTQKSSKFEIPNIEVVNGDSNASLAIDNNSNLIVSYRKYISENWNYKIYVQKFDSNGTPISSELPVNDTTYYYVDKHKVVTASDGSFIVSWLYNGISDWYLFDEDALFIQRYDANSNPIGSNIKIDFALHYRDYQMKMAPDGSFVIAWTGGLKGGDGGSDTFFKCLQKFDSSGNPISSKHQYNSAEYDSIIMGNDGSFIYTWITYDENYQAQSHAQKYNSNGTPSGSEFAPKSPNIYQNMAILNDGKFVQLTEVYNEITLTDIYAQIYNSNGTPYSSEFRVNSNITGDLSSSSISVQSDGSFVINWINWNEDYSLSPLYAKKYDSSGNPL